jgi:HEAT repeat protein
MTTSSDSERKIIIIALGKIGDPISIDPLIKLFCNTTEPAIKEKIVDSIVEIGDVFAVEYLIKILGNSESDDERLQLIRALAFFKDSRANEVLFDLFQRTENWTIKKCIAEILLTTADQETADSIIEFLTISPSLYETLLLLDIIRHFKKPEFIVPLLQLFNKISDYNIKILIIRIITETGDIRAVKHIMEALKTTQSPSDRILLLQVLDFFKDPGANKFLIHQLKNSIRSDVKKMIAKILSETGNEKTVDSLITILQTTSFDYERLILIDALGNLKNQKAIEPLNNLFEKTKEADVKKTIVNALAKIGQSPEKSIT